jgi:hypothetical protein
MGEIVWLGMLMILDDPLQGILECRLDRLDIGMLLESLNLFAEMLLGAAEDRVSHNIGFSLMTLSFVCILEVIVCICEGIASVKFTRPFIDGELGDALFNLGMMVGDGGEHDSGIGGRRVVRRMVGRMIGSSCRLGGDIVVLIKCEGFVWVVCERRLAERFVRVGSCKGGL